MAITELKHGDFIDPLYNAPRSEVREWWDKWKKAEVFRYSNEEFEELKKGCSFSIQEIGEVILARGHVSYKSKEVYKDERTNKWLTREPWMSWKVYKEYETREYTCIKCKYRQGFFQKLTIKYGQSFVGQFDNEEPMLMRVGKLKIVIPHYHDHYKYLKERIMQRAQRLSPDTSKRKYWEQKTIKEEK